MAAHLDSRASRLDERRKGSGRPTGAAGDGQLRAVSLSYLWSFGAAAALIPFISLYYRSIGFEPGAIGWLVGLPLLVGVLAAPVWGAFADATHRHRAVLAGAVASAAVLAVLISSTGRLAILLPIVLLHATAWAPVNPLIDNGALVVLARRPGEYGRLRVWGAVGWGASALGVGWLVAERGPRAIFAVYVGLLIALLTVAVRLPVGERVAEGAFAPRLAALAGDRRLWRFLAVAFLGGTGVSIVNAYLPLYLLGLGAPGLVGVSMLVATLSEMPVMVFGARVLGRLGYGRAFLLGYAVYGGRALVMSFVHAPWGVVALQLLHGPSFAVMWISGVALARRLAPAGLGATAQGLFSSVSTGLGGAVGAVVGGWIFGAIGPAGAFRTAAVLLALVAPLVALVANAERRDPFAR